MKIILEGVSMFEFWLFTGSIAYFVWFLWKLYNKWLQVILGYKNWYRYHYTTMPSWRFSRWVKLTLSGHRCKECRARFRLDVHHKVYKVLGVSILYLEWLFPWWLTVLCRDCHDKVHG